ncbi:MAG: hypothetical protein KGQ70_05655 [Alphaproteobacteria bacterium]|nr:hypothetical protein [Alphaproteobacteria bacterium]
MRPEIRNAFNHAVDRRMERREEPVYDLYFREVSAGNDDGGGFFQKCHDKN